MSFKIKKWAEMRTVNLAERFPHLHPYAPTGGSINTQGFAYPWAGYVICMVYDDEGKSVWLQYDPATDACAGPFPGANMAWCFQSGFYGNLTTYNYWDNRLLFGNPQYDYGFGGGNFCGWDAGCGFWQWKIGADDLGPGPTGAPRRGIWPCCTIGQQDGMPSVMIYSTGCNYNWLGQQTDQFTEWGYIAFGGGYTPIKAWIRDNDPPERGFYLPFYDGTNFVLRQLGNGLYQGEIIYVVDGGADAHDVVWAGLPTLSSYQSFMCEGYFGGGVGFDPMGMTFASAPSGEVIMWVELKDKEGNALPQQWVPSTDPMGSGVRPWQTAWDYRRQLEGVQLDEYDLDGTDHPHSYPMPVDGHKPITQSGGWYYGLDSNLSPLNFTCYVLDPSQPSGAPRRPVRPAGAIGWAGDYALNADLRLAHVQPFPDDRAPSGSNMPPQERSDGFLVGNKELFKGGSGLYTYQRGVEVDLSSYPQGGDWHFPGEADGKFPGFWGLFAGCGPTVIGFMPDPDFGMINPEGQNCMRFLGVPTENLKAAEPGTTHVLRQDMTVQDCTWATPLTGITTGNRQQLICALDGSVFVYTASGLPIASPPVWKAQVGRINGGRWESMLDFDEIPRPNLGETGWTVWSVVPIAKNRALPQGGYLVGATLYFAPWADNEWEERPGTRDAVFTASGNGWVPAKLGWDGPLNNDQHKPVYLTALDEWSVGRSLYGPDALLVYDNTGRFVKCLNSLSVDPPDGREIMVTGEAWPRLVFRVYRHGVYSDYAEYNGMYHWLGDNHEIQAPLYAVYDLLAADGSLGPGSFGGYVDMYEVAQHHLSDHAWRWGVADTLYAWDSPKDLWSPPGGSYVRSGKGGGGITILTPKGSTAQLGVKGVGKTTHG